MRKIKPTGIHGIEDRSPALQLVNLVWTQTAFKSWIRLNHTMQDALALAMKAGLTFEPGDIREISAKMSGHRWFGDQEWIYRLAVEFGNQSACRSYEEWRGRDPFILDGRRLFVGAQVELHHLKSPKGVSALVTSFSSDGMGIVVCTYSTYLPARRSHNETMCWPGGKPLQKIRLGLYEVREIERARVKAMKAAKVEATA